MISNLPAMVVSSPHAPRVPAYMNGSQLTAPHCPNKSWFTLRALINFRSESPGNPAGLRLRIGTDSPVSLIGAASAGSEFLK